VSRLAHPDWALPLLAAWALLALLAGAAVLRARAWLARLGAGTGFAGGARDAALCTALLAIAIALLGPQLGTRSVAVPADGIDLVVLIDVSRSMDAADAAPSRLARAREAARDVLLALAPGDRAALAVYAGHGALLTPLTHDAAALVELLPSLDSEWMADRGSRLWTGIEAALAAFDADGLRPRVVLALGDGERAHLAPDTSFETLARAQVRVVAGAIGSEAGIALLGSAGPLLDWNGQAVVTRRETGGFERFAGASGGGVLVADEWGALDAGALLAEAKRGLRPGPGGTILRELPATHVALPAALAFALLLAELLAGEQAAFGARLRFSRWRRRGAVAAAALLALGAGGTPHLDALEARVARSPEDARTLIALGIARAEAGDPAEAAHALSAAVVRAHEPAVIALASYDLGVALLELGDFAGARDAFFDALAYAPDDRQAKFNLEWALRALERQAPPPAPPEAPPRPETPPPDGDDGDDSAEAPMPEASEAEPEPAPQPEPAGERRTEGEAGAPPEPLAPEEVARWLESVRDVPPPALRRAHGAGAARSGPQW
jgi:Ca-activated chloride channel family protein